MFIKKTHGDPWEWGARGRKRKKAKTKRKGEKKGEEKEENKKTTKHQEEVHFRGEKKGRRKKKRQEGSEEEMVGKWWCGGQNVCIRVSGCVRTGADGRCAPERWRFRHPRVTRQSPRCRGCNTSSPTAKSLRHPLAYSFDVGLAGFTGGDIQYSTSSHACCLHAAVYTGQRLVARDDAEDADDADDFSSTA